MPESPEEVPITSHYLVFGAREPVVMNDPKCSLTWPGGPPAHKCWLELEHDGDHHCSCGESEPQHECVEVEEEEEEEVDMFTCERCFLSEPAEDAETFEVRVNYRTTALWCYRCHTDRAGTCDHCNTTFNLDYYSLSEVDRRSSSWCEDCLCEATWCEGCEQWEYDDVCVQAGDLVHYYSYKPRPIFHLMLNGLPVALNSKPGTAFYGIELESENTDGGISDAVDAVQSRVDEDQFYMKEDGSLSSQGFELVSHPRTLESWEAYRSGFGELLLAMSRAGQRAWRQENCGLHIHVSRDTMTDGHAARFGLLFSRNAIFWQAMANRSSEYASFTGLRRGSVIQKAKTGYRANHMDAVNFSNDTTVEVRIWRPSLAVGRMLGSIQLTAGAVEYTRGLTAHDVVTGALEGLAFSNWVMEQDGFNDAKVIIRGEKFEMEKGYNVCA